MSRTFDSHSTKRVSYILTTKNRAQFLEKALNSYQKLVTSRDELIIVDGASIDETAIVVQRNKKIVTSFLSEPDKNPTEAFNKGILLAKGRYIKNLNDDDIVYPETMEKAIRIMEKHHEIDFLVCGGTKEFRGKYWPFYVPEGVSYVGNFKNIFKYGGCGVGFIVRRSSIALIGLYPQNHIVSDLAYLLQAVRLGANVKFCRLNVFNHKIFKHSAIITKKELMDKDMSDLMKDYCSYGFYIKYKYDEAIHKLINFLFPIK